MNLDEQRMITNHFQDVRLFSLRSWRMAAEIQPRDDGGPYMIGQTGYDPEDLTMAPDEFLLGKHGEWLSTKLFFQLPLEARRDEYVFGTAAQVMATIGNLPSKVMVRRTLEEPKPAEANQETEEFNLAFTEAKLASMLPPRRQND